MNRLTQAADTVVLVDDDAVVRASLGAYLRDCGLRVIEASGIEEAKAIITAHHGAIDVVLCDAGTLGTQVSFEFMAWARQHHRGIEVLIAGTVAAAASLAGDICETGPQLSKPYDHTLVVDTIKRALASRPRATGG